MLFYSLFCHEPELVNIGAGQALFHEGEHGDAMYVLIEGKAIIRIHDQIVEACDVGSIVGEMSVIEPGPRSATVIAMTDCVFAKADEARFHVLVSETPRFALEVMRVMAARMRRTDALLYAEPPTRHELRTNPDAEDVVTD